MCDSLYTVEDWVRYGDELRRPLLVGPKLSKSTKLTIVGAGLSGLSIAFRIATKRPDIEIELLEKTERCGGTIETWSEGEWMCDVAVNAARPHPSFWRLASDLDLGDVFSQSNPRATSRWLFLNKKKSKLSLLTALKMGPVRMFRSIRSARSGGKSIGEIIPNQSVADAMTFGIVNDASHNVDADFLMPSMTKFGEEPPIKWSKIKKMMKQTYPLFTPTKGSIASFEGGMQTLIDALLDRLKQLSNVQIHYQQQYESPEQVALERNVPIDSIIWCAPLARTIEQYTELDVYAVGYASEDIANVPVGYGTLIPDQDIPVSGILHESDVHSSPRAPAGHRLFRVMAPSSRDGDDSTIRSSLKQILSNKKPALYKKIGQRKIPSYSPGYMSKLIKSERNFTRAGWFYSGVSVTHVVAEAERIADLF